MLVSVLLFLFIYLIVSLVFLRTLFLFYFVLPFRFLFLRDIVFLMHFVSSLRPRNLHISRFSLRTSDGSVQNVYVLDVAG